MCTLTIGDIASYPFSWSAEEAPPLWQRDAQEKASQTEALESAHTLNIRQTVWESYLELKNHVLSITLPDADSQKDSMSTVNTMIRACQHKINNVDEDKLRQMVENATDLTFFASHREQNRACLNEVKEAIAAIIQTVDAIKVKTDEENVGTRNKSFKTLYIAAGIALIGVAIGLTAFIAPYALPAVFITGTKATIALDCTARLLGATFAATGIVLGFSQGKKSYLAETTNDSWRHVSEAFSSLHCCLKEVGSINMDVLVDLKNGLTAMDERNQITSEKIDQLTAFFASEVSNSQNLLVQKQDKAITELEKMKQDIEMLKNMLAVQQNTSSQPAETNTSPATSPRPLHQPLHTYLGREGSLSR